MKAPSRLDAALFIVLMAAFGIVLGSVPVGILLIVLSVGLLVLGEARE